MAEPARWLAEDARSAWRNLRRAFLLIWPWWWRATALLIAADLVWGVFLRG